MASRTEWENVGGAHCDLRDGPPLEACIGDQLTAGMIDAADQIPFRN